ncbi:hypothetical protein EMIHUDRAFT_243707 [Emiliania huxleyi CCMP1516]|uniref:PH domain-containing protein n=2 Tax=Emiliania huxleyi TaxID=2903 RepID=A0A0D3J513_EMIH1|nr:hypothetical protein EMIHUDRAFT_243707 [Emiliania huxleyi CCMP1516]EOD18598.1 hypothetical protein EMIHUDRAFT_243707 [Emiliania huxleyi CCMP1516]|eukprot:XP_005771027.1 hypothetical protein EMIHUDRAFT_243707 [Emiliania huxleyi CCMP1516]
MYFNSPKDFTGFRDKPSGVVLLEEANVRESGEGGYYGRPFTFVLSHSGGESVVLAAETEKEMVEWMQAVRTSRLCVTDAEAAAMSEAQRQQAAEADIDAAVHRRADAEAALATVDKELSEVQKTHREVEAEKERAEKELKELMARFKLRKSLLHWRHRKLTFSFRALVTIVFEGRIDKARGAKASADARMAAAQQELEAASAARQKAEARAAVGKGLGQGRGGKTEMYVRELELKKQCEAEEREGDRLAAHEADLRAEAEQEAATPPPGESQSGFTTVARGGACMFVVVTVVVTAGLGKLSLDRERQECLDLRMQLERCRAEGELLQTKLKRRVPTGKSK